MTNDISVALLAGDEQLERLIASETGAMKCLHIGNQDSMYRTSAKSKGGCA